MPRRLRSSRNHGLKANARARKKPSHGLAHAARAHQHDSPALLSDALQASPRQTGAPDLRGWKTPDIWCILSSRATRTMADVIARLFVLGLLVGYAVLFIALAVWMVRQNRKSGRRRSASGAASPLSLTARTEDEPRGEPRQES